MNGPSNGAAAVELLSLARELTKADPKLARINALKNALAMAVQKSDQRPQLAHLVRFKNLPAAELVATIDVAVEVAIKEHLEETVAHLRALLADDDCGFCLQAAQPCG